jgi:hypothetical protein
VDGLAIPSIPTRKEAINKCLEYGKEIIDGKESGFSISNL